MRRVTVIFVWQKNVIPVFRSIAETGVNPTRWIPTSLGGCAFVSSDVADG